MFLSDQTLKKKCFLICSEWMLGSLLLPGAAFKGLLGKSIECVRCSGQHLPSFS